VTHFDPIPAMNSTASLGEFLSQTPMFQGLSVEELGAIAAIAQTQTLTRGEILFSEGDPGTGFYIVQSGRVKVFKLSAEGKEQILKLFTPGEHFAEVPAFDGGCFPATAAALEPSTLLFFPRTACLELLHHYPTVAINILAVFARHLRRFASLIEDLSLKGVPERLAAYLLSLSDRSPQPDHLQLDVTKGQLAAILGTIPETLSRAFSRLSNEGLIATEGATIHILTRSRLKQFSQGGK